MSFYSIFLEIHGFSRFGIWSIWPRRMSSTLFPETPSEVLPPAISTRRPKGAASKARRNLAGDASGCGGNGRIMGESWADYVWDMVEINLIG